MVAKNKKVKSNKKVIVPTTEEIVSLINANKDKLDKARHMWSLYTYERDDLKIFGDSFDKEVPDYVKGTQQKLHNSFYLEIVDTKVDYLLGNGITYNINDENKEEIMEQLNRMDKINSTFDLEWEAATYSSACGYVGRLIYISEDETLEMKDRIKMINIPPWETIVNYNSNGDIVNAIRFYEAQNKVFVERYTEDETEFYEGDSLEDIKSVETKSNLLTGIPFFKITNNKEEKSDTERVVDHVDQYDKVYSNLMSELKGFRDAIFTLSGGVTISAETLEFMKKNGVLVLPSTSSSENKVEAKWLIKELPVQNFEVADDSIRRSINQFSQHVDFSEEAFAGDLTNFNITFKLMPLDIKASKYETKLTKALDYQFKIIFAFWNLTLSTDIYDYFDLKYQFIRKKPRNKLEDADEQVRLDGLVSNDTRLSLHPDIDDPTAEMRKMKDEEEGQFKKEMDVLDEN